MAALALVGAAPVQAALLLSCTHVTKSTLMADPLARPLFGPEDTVTLELDDVGGLTVWVADQPIPASLRLCRRGGRDVCTDVRGIEGDVVSFYNDVIGGPRPLHAIWGRKGAGARDLIENVMMTCTSATRPNQ